MKIIKLFISAFTILLISSEEGLCQTAIQDAQKIKSLLEGTMNEERSNSVSNILINYIDTSITNNDTLTAEEVRNEFLDNPFIPRNYKVYTVENAGLGLTKALSSFGDLDVTAFADGLAKFLVKRTKEELYVSFFSKLQDSTKYPEFKVLFPHTKLLVDNFKNWEYANITNTLREAFDKDFKVLLENLPKVNGIDTLTCKCDTQAIKRVRAMKIFFNSDNGLLFLTASGIANGFLIEQKVPDIFHNAASSLTKISTINDDHRNAIKLFDIISYSLRSNVAGESYISWNAFNTMDDTTRNIYFGLLYQQFKNEDIVIRNKRLTDIFTPANVGRATNIQSFFRNLLTEGDDVANAYKNLRDAKKKGEEDLSAYWSGIFESGQTFLNKTTSNLVLIDPVFEVPVQIRNTLITSSRTLAIAHDISVRNYSAVVVGTLALISEHLGNSNEIAGFKSFFVKYASFGANVVQAKNSDDIEKAIEAVVLPIGSARIKRETIANISLNAFVGLHASHEFIKGIPDKLFFNAYGIAAPVGVSFAWGTRAKKDTVEKRKNGKAIGGKSNGIFVSLIDIGAITTLRFGDDKTEQLPTIQLKDIISPGLFYSHGFGKLPISVNIGGQYGPLLREITPNVATKGSTYWRVGISVLVDIPLLNLYTKN